MLFRGDYRDLSIDPESVSLVFCDPPYGVGYQNQYTKNKHEVLKGDAEAFDYGELARFSHQILKPNSPILLFTSWSVYSDHYKQVEAAGFKMKEPLICQKRPSGTSDLLGSFQTNSDWLLFAHKGRFKFKETTLLRNKKAGVVSHPGRKPVPEFKTRFPSNWAGDQYPQASESSTFQKKLLSAGAPCTHPTIKGLEFCKWVIQLTTNPGDLVVDLCAGSGTTLLAAQQTGRAFLGCEVDPRFQDLIQWRLAHSV